MGRIVSVNIMSLNGFYEGPGRDVKALPYDDAFHAYNLEQIQAADAVLLGATSYQGFSEYWPAFESDPAASGPYRAFSTRYNAIEKVVVSDHASLPAPGHPWARTTRIVKRADAHREVASLRQTRNAVMWGSRTLWTDLLKHGLLDELHLIVLPTVLDGGTPLFATPPASIRLAASRTLDDSSDALLRYVVH